MAINSPKRVALVKALQEIERREGLKAVLAYIGSTPHKPIANIWFVRSRPAYHDPAQVSMAAIDEELRLLGFKATCSDLLDVCRASIKTAGSSSIMRIMYPFNTVLNPLYLDPVITQRANQILAEVPGLKFSLERYAQGRLVGLLRLRAGGESLARMCQTDGELSDILFSALRIEFIAQHGRLPSIPEIQSFPDQSVFGTGITLRGIEEARADQIRLAQLCLKLDVQERIDQWKKDIDRQLRRGSGPGPENIAPEDPALIDILRATVKEAMAHSEGMKERTAAQFATCYAVGGDFHGLGNAQNFAHGASIPHTEDFRL